MGLSPFSGSSRDYSSLNPNPKNYQIIKGKDYFSKICAVIVNFTDCNNFEGNKILVFKCSLSEIYEQDEIDPHFSQDTDKYYPIARFKPNDSGWRDAVQYCSKKCREEGLYEH